MLNKKRFQQAIKIILEHTWSSVHRQSNYVSLGTGWQQLELSLSHALTAWWAWGRKQPRVVMGSVLVLRGQALLLHFFPFNLLKEPSDLRQGGCFLGLLWWFTNTWGCRVGVSALKQHKGDLWARRGMCWFGSPSSSSVLNYCISGPWVYLMFSAGSNSKGLAKAGIMNWSGTRRSLSAPDKAAVSQVLSANPSPGWRQEGSSPNLLHLLQSWYGCRVSCV